MARGSGIDQWRPGVISRPSVVERAAGEVIPALGESRPVSAPARQRCYPPLWSEAVHAAAYAQRLADHRFAAGQGLGRALLHGAEERVAIVGKRHQWLDGVGENPALRRCSHGGGDDDRGAVASEG